MDVQKAYEITDAKIQFVSLVDKAANLKSFLITKAADGQATFSTFGRIVKKNAEQHFVTGIVYEPMAEDAHGNFMTEAEITKAAYWFNKNSSKVDLQHSFEPLPGATVVESWVAKADFDIDSEHIAKGTWLMTVELGDEGLWDAIEKGEITGFSMGGMGNYSEEDVTLEDVKKDTGKGPEQGKEKGLFKKLAHALGFEVVEKGEMSEEYQRRMKSNSFWTAFWTLQDVLCRYDGWTGKEYLEEDEATVREALTEFSSIVQEVLTGSTPLTKALATEEPISKAGKTLSGKNRDTLQGIYDTLGTFLAEACGDPDDEKEDKEVTKAEIEKLVQDSVEASVKKALEGGEQKPAPAAAPAPGAEAITSEAVQKMVEEAVAKALTPAEEPVTAENIEKMISAAVEKAVEPVLKARGVPTALNDNPGAEKPVEKHYLHGIL